MATITLVKGDKNYTLEFSVIDADGGIVDLTSSAVLLKIQKYGQSTLTTSIAGTISVATLGLCGVPIGTELENQEGRYHAELQITWGTGQILTAPQISIKILRDLPR